MSAKWVAANVRAKALLSRRVGSGRARMIATTGSLTEAQHVLADSPYGRYVVVGQTSAATDHAVTSALLWHLRVLAGWQPAEGAHAVRALAAGFEVANICAHARRLAGAPPQSTYSYALGGLTTAWSRLAGTSSLAQLRHALSETLWGDPESESPSDIAVAVQTAWAVRVATTVPEASPWAYAGLALLVARRRLLDRRGLPPRAAARAERLLGASALAGADLASFAQGVPARGRWVLAGLNDAGQLWRGEARWWSRLESDGFELAARPGFSRARTIGAVAVLTADAWRCRAAVQLAAHGGEPMELYDALA